MQLDGIITFESSYHALRAERLLKQAAIPGKLVPAPRELSPTCVTALRFPWPSADQVESLMVRHAVEYDRSCHYPEQQGLPSGWASL